MKKGKSMVVWLLLAALTAAAVSGCAGGKAAGTTEGSRDPGAAVQESAAAGPESGEPARPQATAAAGEAEAMADTSVFMGNRDGAWFGAAPDGEVRPERFNTEEYNYIEENPFLAVKNEPLSTFAADVDTASYANLRRMVLAGETVPADAVRIEEMLNYFHYDYPQPQEGEPFSVTTRIGTCPWNEEHQLLQIGLQARNPDMEQAKPSNLVFLIDVSGSMDEPNKLGLVKRAFLLLTENLKPEDTISLVTYASGDQVVADGVSGGEKAVIMTAIENLWAGGSTAGAAGIETAYELAEKHFIEGGNNRVILATDGDLNVGISSEGDLTRLIREKKESGVYLSVLGFGTGNIKDNKMEALADNGNGQYAYVDTIAEARKVLVEEMGGTLFTVAKDVKLQVEFNPAKVKGYRLIGYENRLMEARDFDDDTKDGGEIGAGHRVTALYELVPAGSDEDLGEVELKYQGNESVSDEAAAETGEWMTLKIRYKEPDGTDSRLLEYPVDDTMFCRELPQDMEFAACVAETGMLLRDSEHGGNASYEQVVKTLESMEGFGGDSYKEEFLYLVKRLKAME